MADHPPIDPSQIRVLPLIERQSQINISKAAVSAEAVPTDPGLVLGPKIQALATRIKEAKKNGAAVMLTYGAHMIKNGGALVLKALIQEGFVTHLATQGAGIVHDLEFAFQGSSSENVRENVPEGRFGTWDETGRYINLAALAGAAQGLGLGAAVGKFIVNGGLTDQPNGKMWANLLRAQIRQHPDHDLTAARLDLVSALVKHKLDKPETLTAGPFQFVDYSITAAAWKAGVPLTVHPGIGYDIFATHPMFSGAAIGRAAGTDFYRFTQSVMNLSGGVYLSMGSAIMSPQVFEKALSVANNLLLQRGQRVSNHFIGVVDLQDGGGWDWSKGEPPMDHPAYYLRFCKSFYRMGGAVDYLCGDNMLVLTNLLWELRK